MGSRIVSTGRATPRTAVSNDDLSRGIDTSDEWIRTRTGIGARYLMRSGESLVDVAAEASRIALERAGLKPSDLDAIVVGTVSSEYAFPSFACSLQTALGADHDSRIRCRGRVFGICLRALGRRFLDSCGRLSARAGSRHRCALDHGRLERSAHLRAVRRRRGRGGAGRGTRPTRRPRQPAALLGQVLGSPFGARDRARVHRSIPRFIATPTMRSR